MNLTVIATKTPRLKATPREDFVKLESLCFCGDSWAICWYECHKKNFVDIQKPGVVSCGLLVGRGDLKQIAPRKTCAKPQAKFSKSPRCLARAFCVLIFKISEGVAI